MGNEKRKILEMLSKGKIDVEEAERLLCALTSDNQSREKNSGPDAPGSARPRYLMVVVEPGEGSEKKERVNIRVPIKLIRSGIRWASFIPKEAQEKVNEAFRDKGMDMDFTKMTGKELEELVDNLSDLSIDVEGKEKVRLYCE